MATVLIGRSDGPANVTATVTVLARKQPARLVLDVLDGDSLVASTNLYLTGTTSINSTVTLTASGGAIVGATRRVYVTLVSLAGGGALSTVAQQRGDTYAAVQVQSIAGVSSSYEDSLSQPHIVGTSRNPATVNFGLYWGYMYSNPDVIARKGDSLWLTSPDGQTPHTITSDANDEYGQPLFSSPRTGLTGGIVFYGDGWPMAQASGVEKLPAGVYPFHCSFHGMRGTLTVLL